MLRFDAQVTVLTTNAGGLKVLNVPLKHPLEVDGVTVWYFPLKFRGLGYFYASGLFSKVFELVKQADVVFTDAVWGYASFPVSLACQYWRKPYVVQLHGQLEPWSLSQKWVKKQIYLGLWGRRFLTFASGLFCTSFQETESVRKLKLRSASFVLPLGVDTSTFAELQQRNILRTQLNIPDRAPVLLFLGRLHHKKRPDLAIQLLGLLPENLQNVHLVLAGPDQENLIPGLLATAQKLGCQARVHFTGLLDRQQILQAFAAADLLVMPSEPQSENFGLSAVEAMAAGLPVLVSEGVPVGHWAVQAGAGRVEPCDAQAFACAVAEMLSDPSRLAQMGANGRALVREKFEIGAVTRQLLAQFQSIIDTGRPLDLVDDA
jgi:glycosyltransferase involved in cell wall biosynthesis